MVPLMPSPSYFERLSQSLQMWIGSRFFVGLAGAAFITFFGHVLFAPERLPALGFINPYSLGLAYAPPPAPELLPEVAAMQAKQAAQAGLPYLWDALVKFFAVEGRTTALNTVMLAISSVGLVMGIYLLAKQDVDSMR
jgi:hypothetical protein